MRYPGQIQAVIDILTLHAERPSPLDKLMAHYFKTHRYIGSKDKGVIADKLYGLFRRFGEVEFVLNRADLPKTPRTHILAYLMLEADEVLDIFTGEQYAPEKLSEKEKSLSVKKIPSDVQMNMPEWLYPYLEKAFKDDWKDAAKALHGRAPTDIRTNTLKTSRGALQKHLKKEGFDLAETEHSPLCLRMPSRRSMFGLDLFKQGHFEVQDEGSQLIAQMCDVKAGDKVVDFCAGAGGKTLALAAQMRAKGTLYACDIHERRLSEMPKRLKRAGVADMVRTVLLESETDKWVKRHKGKMDCVLVDAPCSGAGTWRRSPDALWKLTESSLKNLMQTQENILKSAARLVKDGGSLVYATCSVFAEENMQQIEKFLTTHDDFRLVEHHQLAPHTTDTDGFFMAKLVRGTEELEDLEEFEESIE